MTSTTCRAALLALLALALLTPAAPAHSPHDVINVVAITEGADGEQVLFARAQLTSKGLFVRSFDSGRTWSVTALPVNEREISRIAFSPDFASDDTVFLSTTDLGLLKSTDRGDSWTVLNGGGLDPRVLDLVVSPDFATSQKLIAATAVGPMISTDGGLTWTPELSGLTSPALSRLAVSPSHADVLLGGKTVLHRSDDGGLTWTPLWTFPAAIQQLSLSPTFAFDGTAIVCLSGGEGIFTTQDGGASWQAMVLGLPEATVNDVVLGRQGQAFCVTPVAGLFRATVGQPWEAVGEGFEILSDLSTNHFRTVDLSPDFAQDDNVWVGGFEGLFRSEDRGELFRPMDIYHQQYVRSLVLAPDYGTSGRIFLQLYGGGLLTTPGLIPSLAGTGTPGAAGPGSAVLEDGTAGTAGHAEGGHQPTGVQAGPSQPVTPLPPWESRSGTITALFGQCLDLSPDWPADPTLFYAQSGLWRSDDATRSWTTLPMPPGTDVLRVLSLSPGFGSDRLVIVGAGLGGGVFRSHDAGASWIQLSAGLPAEPAPGEILFSPDFSVDQTLFLADRETGFYRSLDGGDSWLASSDGIVDPTLQCLAMSPDFANDQTLLVGGSEGGIQRSTDGGLTWLQANTGLPEDLPLSVESLAFSPDFVVDRTVFAAILQAGTWRSTDGGLSWAPVGPGLPPDAPRVVAVSPAYAQDGTVLVSTHSWTWISRDQGQSWERLPGYARIDNGNNVLVQALAQPQPLQSDDAPSAEARLAELSRRYGGLSPELVAFLLEGACEGGPAREPGDDGAAGAAYGAAGDGSNHWPIDPWPAGALSVGVSVSQAAGDYVELDFVGDSLRWYAPRGPDMGVARVIVDGQLQALVDLYAPVEEPSQVRFEQHFPGPSFHRVRLLNFGQKNPASSGITLRSDGFDYTY